MKLLNYYKSWFIALRLLQYNATIAAITISCKPQLSSIYLNNNVLFIEPVPVGERSEAWICGRSPAGMAGSNSAGGMDNCLL